jgi:hypothetical protein
MLCPTPSSPRHYRVGEEYGVNPLHDISRTSRKFLLFSNGIVQLQPNWRAPRVSAVFFSYDVIELMWLNVSLVDLGEGAPVFKELFGLR